MDKKEIARQSALFEIIQSEKEYVRDMRLVGEIFVQQLRDTTPIPQSRLEGFISEVFYNMYTILSYHERLLDRLFERQREQHPLMQSIADIVLDSKMSSCTAIRLY